MRINNCSIFDNNLTLTDCFSLLKDDQIILQNHQNRCHRFEIAEISSYFCTLKSF